MYDKGIFVFGSKIISTDSQDDSVSCLPLELSWHIFAYLDDIALRNASYAFKKWRRIILANRKLRNRLNTFELSIVLGSEKLARFHRKNKKRLRRRKSKNYLPTGSYAEDTMKNVIVTQTKRSGDNITLYTKRYKLY